MKTEASYDGGTLCLRLSGELDHHAAKETMAAIEREIDRRLPKRCVLELSGLTFMDSSGIAVMLRTYRRMNELGGTVIAAAIQPQPMRVVSAAGIGRIISVSAAG